MNDKPIIITESSENINNCEVFNFKDVNFKTVKKQIELEEVSCVCLLSDNLQSDWEDFKSNFKVIAAAGGKVTNQIKETLFIYRFDKWDLPKGHIEKGEDKETAAIREVEEECGVSGLSIVKELDTTYHSFSYKNELSLKVTYWFEMQTNFSGELSPQLEEGITKVAFKSEKQTQEALQNTYLNIRLLFK